MYLISPNKLKNTSLLIASLIFYGWGEPKYVFLMMATIIMFYVLGLLIERVKSAGKKKAILVLSIVISIGILGIFKYADFFIKSFNAATGLNVSLLRLALPVGISFYTFQCLSYVVDVYRGTVTAQRNPIAFGTYVTMFPQLIAGPIVRYSDIEQSLSKRKHSWEDIYAGLRRFSVGLAKKVLISDQLAQFISAFRASQSPTMLFYWMYAITFTLQIYFDFSGYSDMAIGLGKMIGFRFMENFNYPYMSKSIGEFWRRWHMSLGSWFRDYVYIPLGGNRVKTGRWVFNTLVVWMLTGLWHGASWNFVLWGLFFAVLLMLEKFSPAIRSMPSVIRWLSTIACVMFGFVIFNAESMGQAVSDLSGMFRTDIGFFSDELLYYLGSYSVVFLMAIVGATNLPKKAYQRIMEKRIPSRIIGTIEPMVVIGFILLSAAFLIDGSFSPFLYFRF